MNFFVIFFIKIYYITSSANTTDYFIYQLYVTDTTETTEYFTKEKYLTSATKPPDYLTNIKIEKNIKKESEINSKNAAVPDIEHFKTYFHLHNIKEEKYKDDISKVKNIKDTELKEDDINLKAEQVIQAHHDRRGHGVIVHNIYLPENHKKIAGKITPATLIKDEAVTKSGDPVTGDPVTDEPLTNIMEDVTNPGGTDKYEEEITTTLTSVTENNLSNLITYSDKPVNEEKMSGKIGDGIIPVIPEIGDTATEAIEKVEEIVEHAMDVNAIANNPKNEKLGDNEDKGIVEEYERGITNGTRAALTSIQTEICTELDSGTNDNVKVEIGGKISCMTEVLDKNGNNWITGTYENINASDKIFQKCQNMTLTKEKILRFRVLLYPALANYHYDALCLQNITINFNLTSKPYKELYQWIGKLITDGQVGNWTQLHQLKDDMEEKEEEVENIAVGAGSIKIDKIEEQTELTSINCEICLDWLSGSGDKIRIEFGGKINCTTEVLHQHIGHWVTGTHEYINAPQGQFGQCQNTTLTSKKVMKFRVLLKPALVNLHYDSLCLQKVTFNFSIQSKPYEEKYQWTGKLITDGPIGKWAELTQVKVEKDEGENFQEEIRTGTQIGRGVISNKTDTNENEMEAGVHIGRGVISEKEADGAICNQDECATGIAVGVGICGIIAAVLGAATATVAAGVGLGAIVGTAVSVITAVSGGIAGTICSIMGSAGLACRDCGYGEDINNTDEAFKYQKDIMTVIKNLEKHIEHLEYRIEMPQMISLYGDDIQHLRTIRHHFNRLEMDSNGKLIPGHRAKIFHDAVFDPHHGVITAIEEVYSMLMGEHIFKGRSLWKALPLMCGLDTFDYFEELLVEAYMDYAIALAMRHENTTQYENVEFERKLVNINSKYIQDCGCHDSLKKEKIRKIPFVRRNLTALISFPHGNKTYFLQSLHQLTSDKILLRKLTTLFEVRPFLLNENTFKYLRTVPLEDMELLLSLKINASLTDVPLYEGAYACYIGRCQGEDNGCCTAQHPCNIGEGDCDPGTCKEGLVCGNNNCVNYTLGHWSPEDDCCIHPNLEAVLTKREGNITKDEIAINCKESAIGGEMRKTVEEEGTSLKLYGNNRTAAKVNKLAVNLNETAK